MMTQLHINVDYEELKAELMESNLGAVSKSYIVIMMNAYMEMERDQYVQTTKYERHMDRQDYRNGYYSRDYVTGLGKIELKVPRTRSGEFTTEAFERYQRQDQALIVMMLEMVVSGTSTRKVTKAVEQITGTPVSKSFVSSLMAQLDEVVNPWAKRPLNHQYYRYVYVDAMYIKVRENQRVVSKAVYIALGVDQEDKRDIIGLHIGDAESENNWSTFFQSLLSRGLQMPRLVVSDAHEGLKSAIRQKFLGASWQRCVAHFLRNICDHMPKKEASEARRLLKSIFQAESLAHATELKKQYIETYQDQKKFEKTVQTLERGFDDATQFYTEHPDAWRHIKTTNTLERLNQEVRRREQVARIFPNEKAAFRLIGAVLMDYNDNLDRGNRKYIYRANT